VPAPITLKVAVWPTVTLCEPGCVVIVGAVELGGVVEVPEEGLLDEPPPQAARSNAVRASEVRIRMG
jgi:hypothetical protein